MFKLNCVGSGYYISIKAIAERLAMLFAKFFYIKLIAVLLTCSSVVVLGQSVSEMKHAQMEKQNDASNTINKSDPIEKTCVGLWCVNVDKTEKSTDCYN